MATTIDTQSSQITLSCGSVVLIDVCDIHLSASRKWRFRRSGGVRSYEYVTANTDAKQLFLHREIMCASPGQVVDHINEDRLDNRRANLRFVTLTQNMRNRKKHSSGVSSRFKGVCSTKSRRWKAFIRNGEKQLYLGTFDNESEAAYAYDMASLQLHGEFGRRNFLPLC